MTAISVDQLGERPIHVTELGQGPRVVLVHGAMTSGGRAWRGQTPLARRWRLVIPDRRGFHPNPPAERSDFDVDATDMEPLLGDGAHLVGHSYGGLITMLLAARRPELVRSLTLIEPAAHALALAHLEVLGEISRYEKLRDLSDPEEFLDGFLQFLGLPLTNRPRPMGARTAQHVGMAMRERPPWSADIATASLVAHPYPVLVISGGRGDVFEVLADATAAAYGAETTATVAQHSFPNTGHDVQTIGGPVNDVLESFWLGSPTDFKHKAPPLPTNILKHCPRLPEESS